MKAALLALALALPAVSAPWVCTVVPPAAPPTVRAEGMTELLTDIVITCTGGDSVITADFTLLTGTNMTSRIIDADTGLSEAMLLTDEPGPGPTFATVQKGDNKAIFHGVPLLPGGQRTFRITNVRANVSGLSCCGPPTFPASLQISGSVPVANPVFTVGFIRAGLTAALRDPTNTGTAIVQRFAACQPVDSPTAVAALQFTEYFAGAFKTRAGANSESGFVYPGFAGGGHIAGLADYGTRPKAVSKGVPAGVRLFVSTTDLAGNSAVLVPDESFVGTVPAADVFPITKVNAGATDVAEVPVVNSTAIAVWEVVNTDPTVLESLAFGVWQQFSNNPLPSTVTVNLSYAPTPTNGAFSASAGTSASATLPLPRFVDTSLPQKLFTIMQCERHPAR